MNVRDLRSAPGWLPFVSLFLSSLVSVGLRAGAGDLVHYTDGNDAIAYAVSVERGQLAYTRQFFAGEAAGGKTMIDELSRIAESCGGDLSSVVRLNLFLSDSSAELRKEALSLVRSRWPAGKTPAITLVPGPLPDGAAMACDAVIAINGKSKGIRSVSHTDGEVHAVIAPAACDLVYASGRVAKGESYGISIPTAMTLILEEYIFPQGSGPGDVLQVRAYIHDLEGAAAARELIEKHFDPGKVPPIVFVAWAREETVEIEVISIAPENRDVRESVSFYTPPGMPVSPAFSRVALVHGKRLVFYGGMSGREVGTPRVEVDSLFETLQGRVKATGATMRNLVKATYMVNDPEVDRVFSERRLRFLDPERPPAASKVLRSEVSSGGRHLLIDLIAAPGAE